MTHAKYILVTLIVLWVSSVSAQEFLKLRQSPTAIVACRYKDTYLKITYCQPQRKGRKIFGGLVPFGEVWRTGANEATEITLTRNVLINGLPLEAGTYSIFTIPDKDKWTIIINSDLGLWGAYNYNQKVDVLRFDVPVETIEDTSYDAFTIQIDQKNSVADLLLLWDKTKIRIPIQFIEPKQP